MTNFEEVLDWMGIAFLVGMSLVLGSTLGFCIIAVFADAWKDIRKSLRWFK